MRLPLRNPLTAVERLMKAWAARQERASGPRRAEHQPALTTWAGDRAEDRLAVLLPPLRTAMATVARRSWPEVEEVGLAPSMAHT
jgi:hypothetical protein